MSTHDYILANAAGAAFRSDINSALAAIVSNNSSATEPATMYAYMFWADTTLGIIWQRNAANSAWEFRMYMSRAITATTRATTTTLATTLNHTLSDTSATITAFNGVAGVTYHCRALGAGSITHHATNLIVTQGGADITTEAGATFDIEMITATTSRLKNYQRAQMNASLAGATFTGPVTWLGGGAVSTNTAYGTSAMAATATGGGNTAYGHSSLNGLTSGVDNTIIGHLAGDAITSGASNSAIGRVALTSLTTGGGNCAVGEGAGFSITTQSYNTCLGASAGRLNTAHSTTLVGISAGHNNLANYSTFVGYYAGYANTSGASNTAVGQAALYVNTTGSGNTAVGQSALYSNSTGSYNTAIGDLSLNVALTANNCSGLGYNAQVTGSNQIQLGDASTTTYAYGAVQNRSDIRDKAEVRDTVLGLEFIMALRPVDFKWDFRDDYRTPMPEFAQGAELAAWIEANKLCNITHNGSKVRGRYHHGLIAQEVKRALDTLGVDFGGYQDHSLKGGDDVKSVGYEELIAPLIKSIQELKAELDAYKAAHP